MDVVAGSTDVTTYFVLRKTADATELTGATITNIDLVYTRSGSDHVAKQDATALATPDSAHSDNKAIEVDATSAPGLYRVDWPDAAFAAGAREVILTVIYSTAFTEHLRVNLTPHGVDVLSISGDTTAADNCEAMFDGTGYAGGAIKLGVDAVALSGDTAAADNAEAMFDGTGYAGGTVKLQVNLVSILGTALTETAGQIAAAFKKFFDVAAPTATCLSLPDAVPGAAGGLPTTNGTKVLQTVDLTAGQSIAASSVPNVTLANGAHGGAAATITLQTPIVANATQIEGVDATDQIDARLTAVLNTAIPGGLVADSPYERLKALDDHVTADYGATEKAAIDLLDDVDGGLADIHTVVNGIETHAHATDGHITADYGAVEKAAIDLLDDAAGGLLDIHTDVADLHVDVADVHTDVNAGGMNGSAAAPVIGSWGQLLNAVTRGDYQYDKVLNVETIMDSAGNVIATLTVVDGALLLTKT